jgi:hypothetical protein
MRAAVLLSPINVAIAEISSLVVFLNSDISNRNKNKPANVAAETLEKNKISNNFFLIAI